MSFTYVIGSYRGVPQLARLVRRINTSSPAATVVVLRDRAAPAVEPAQLGRCEVRVTARSIVWGDASHLLSILDLLRSLDVERDDWITLLSDQSYPLRPLAEYERHLSSSSADSMLMPPSDDAADPGDVLDRYRARSMAIPLSRYPVVRRGLLALGRRSFLRFQAGRPGLPVRLDLPRREPDWLRGTTIHAGSDWYVLRGTAVSAVLAPERRRLLRYFTTTFSPSEAYVHTVLLGDPSMRNIPQASHYTRWRGRAHPEVLDLDDLAEVLASGAWFARKFDDGPVLDVLDAHLVEAQGAGS